MEIEEKKASEKICPVRMPVQLIEQNPVTGQTQPGQWVPVPFDQRIKQPVCGGLNCAAWRESRPGFGFCGLAGPLPMRFPS